MVQYILNWPHRILVVIALMVGIGLGNPHSVIASDTPAKGNLLSGGQLFRIPCPAGSYLVGFSGRVGAWIDQLTPYCAPLLSDRTLGPSQPTPASAGTGMGGTAVEPKICFNRSIVKDFKFFSFSTGDAGQPKDLQLINYTCATQDGNPHVYLGIGISPRDANDGHSVFCPPNEFATGIHGRASQFVHALGLICGPLVPQKLGTGTLPQGRQQTTAKPTAPTVISPKPNGMIVKGRDVFKIVPSPYLNTGILATYQLRWLDAPADAKKAGLDFTTQSVSLSLLTGGLPVPQTLLAPGTWEFRAQIGTPKASDWSPWVRFTYFRDNPILTTPQQGTATTRPSSTAIPQGTMSQALPPQCLSGFVWRAARETDLVCAPPASRDRVKQENAAAASRRSPTGGPYGPNTCLAGFVWREAYDQDVVCVPPTSRTMAREENALSASRTAGGGQSSSFPMSPIIRRGVEGEQSTEGNQTADQPAEAQPQP